MGNKYSKLRKEAQRKGEFPDWYTTAGYQMFMEKYSYKGQDFQQTCDRIARTAARHLPDDLEQKYYERFYDLLWKGWLSPSTPILANMGTDRGLPVSCSGGIVEDSIDGFYTARREGALLTKYGFGISSYLGEIRPRGSSISKGGVASGTLPVVKGFIQDTKDVSQGHVRRGAWAGYIEIDHPDFDEIADHLLAHPDGNNIGWIVGDKFITSLSENNSESLRRYQKSLKIKMVTGKGYFFFTDKVNKNRPPEYLINKLDVKASNLCTEITLHSDKDHTFVCVLASMNLAKWDEWKDTEAVLTATVFLDCVNEEFIQQATGISGLENAVRSAIKGRALGLGECGLHTLLQQKGIVFGSLEHQYLTREIEEHIQTESKKASYAMGELLGIPEWGIGKRNTHLRAIAPTKSTALLMGGVSEGINPDPAMVYQQATSAGEVERICPELLKFLIKYFRYDTYTIQSILDHKGSIQHLDWISDHNKKVFRTAFEINQKDIIRLASIRQTYLDQMQSINLFFATDLPEEWISEVHKEAFLDKNVHSLYYCYSNDDAKGNMDCEACN